MAEIFDTREKGKLTFYTGGKAVILEKSIRVVSGEWLQIGGS